MAQTNEQLILDADLLFRQKNYSGLISLLNDQVLAASGDARAYYYRALAWYYQKEYAKAIEDYTSVIRLDEKNKDAYYGRGLAWYYLQDYTKAIEDYTSAIRLDENNKDAYYGRGLAWHFLKEYGKAIEDYNKVIQLDENYKTAYYNRGLVWHDQQDYDKAIEDYNKVIQLDDKYKDAYYGRGRAWYNKKEYDRATEDFDKAIEIDDQYANPYYIKALLSERSGNYDNAIREYRRYIDLTNNSADYYTQVALSEIEKIGKKKANDWYDEIDGLVSKIKQLLLFDKRCLTHYSSLTGARAMILSNSPFRLSEGAFLNDTSEGRELFKYLAFVTAKPNTDETIALPFAEKPFIGSFVSDNKHDDLTLWRMYGKEAQVEAKGCALTILREQFINNLKEKLSLSNTNNINSLSSSKTGGSSLNDGQYTFYKVAYRSADTFLVPGSIAADENELNELMHALKEKAGSLDNEQRISVTKLLNDIAYLFKSAEYQYENEVRLVVQGVGFKKEISPDGVPPKVYIELIDIASVLHKITLGPKVERADEWAAAFNYHIKEQYPKRNENVEIVISHLPFK